MTVQKKIIPHIAVQNFGRQLGIPARLGCGIGESLLVGIRQSKNIRERTHDRNLV